MKNLTDKEPMDVNGNPVDIETFQRACFEVVADYVANIGNEEHAVGNGVINDVSIAYSTLRDGASEDMDAPHIVDLPPDAPTH